MQSTNDVTIALLEQIEKLTERVAELERSQNAPAHEIGDVPIDRSAPPIIGSTVRYNGTMWVYAP